VLSDGCDPMCVVNTIAPENYSENDSIIPKIGILRRIKKWGFQITDNQCPEERGWSIETRSSHAAPVLVDPGIESHYLPAVTAI
jgi:hypothetical protein